MFERPKPTSILSGNVVVFESLDFGPTTWGDNNMDPAFIIQLLSGAAGGTVAGSLMKNMSLGMVGNALSGLVGGGIGGKLLGGLLGVAAAKAGGGGLDMGTIIGSVISGGAGGGVLMTVIGLIKQMMAK